MFSSLRLFQEETGLRYGLSWVFLQETQDVQGHQPTNQPDIRTEWKIRFFQNHQKYFDKCLESFFNNTNCGEHLGFHVPKDILSSKSREQSNGQAYDALRFCKCIKCISDARMQLFCATFATFCNLFLNRGGIVVTNCCEGDE